MPTMGRWRKTLRIKQFLSDDGFDANAREVAGKVAAVLKRQHEYWNGSQEDWSFAIVADEFWDISESSDATCADFNETLASLYDWADANRVWIDG